MEGQKKEVEKGQVVGLGDRCNLKGCPPLLNNNVSTGFPVPWCHHNAENMKHVPRCPDVFLHVTINHEAEETWSEAPSCYWFMNEVK